MKKVTMSSVPKTKVEMNVTPELVDRLHQDGFLVRAWGVSTEELMEQVVEAGADGMTVIFPDKLTAYLLCQ